MFNENIVRGSIFRKDSVIRMKSKYTKGEYLYLQNKKKMEIIKTVVFFGISVILYIAGYVTTGSNKNYLTIVAVLGCLPASKNAVTMIMNLRVKGCTEAIYKNISSKIGEETGAYNLYFTSYDKNYDISHVFVKGMTMIAFTQDAKLLEAGFEEHIKTVLNRDAIKGVNIKVYKDLDKYLTRVQQMQNLENEKSREEDIMKTLYAVSL